jgi:hypothetical protein
MTEESAAPARTRTRSREQLLRLLHDDPHAVSRAEIKAAFADGRLGDQDLDIPVLAGMRRITELLSELDPNIEATAPSGTVTGTPVRAAPSGVRIAELEAQLGLVTDRLAAVEARRSADDEALAATDKAVAATDKAVEALGDRVERQERTMRLLAIAVVVLAALAVILLVLRLTAS